MLQEAQELLKRALALPDKERAELAGTLIDSLDSTVDEDTDAAWQGEIARRLEEIRSGKVRASLGARFARKHTRGCMASRPLEFHPDAKRNT